MSIQTALENKKYGRNERERVERQTQKKVDQSTK
jgi:hypothetical protein